MLARRWYLLAVLTCSYGLGAFGMLGVSPLSPALMHGFALSRLEVAYAYGAAWMCSPPSPPWSRWSCRRRRRDSSRVRAHEVC